MSNLLEKASILLTPTAYDDGKILSVEPEDGTGDFDFTRNSSATRVNSQGLIEDMQILSSNLVSNGDFSQEGSELVTNGDFSNGVNNWAQGSEVSSFTVTNGIATIQGNASSFNTRISQSISVTIGKTYKITGEIKSNDAGDYRVRLFNGSYLDITNGNNSEFQTFTYYHNATTSTAILYLSSYYSNGSADFSIDNVSVKEVGQDWDLGTGWSIGDGKATFENSQGADNLIQTSVLEVGKYYKLTFDTLEANSTTFAYSFGSSFEFISPIEPNSTYTVFGTASSTSIRLRGTSLFNGSITNVSVIEITDDTNLPRIDYSPYSGAGSCGHWLFEPQSTNLLPYSQDFTQSTWVKQTGGVASAPIVTSNYSISPNGGLNADRIIFNINGGTTSSDFSQINDPVTASIGNVTNSIYVKSNTASNYNMSLVNANVTAIDNILVTTEWQRFEVNAITTTTAASFRLRLRGSESTSDFADVSVWGAQVEESSYATSIIPTSGSTVTRLQDAANEAGSIDLINSTEGVLYAEIASFISTDATEPNRYITITNGTSNERIALLLGGNPNQLRAIAFSNTQSINLSFTTSSTDAKQFNKLAIKYKSGDYAFFLNGVKIGGSTEANIFTTDTLNDLSFDVGGGTQKFRGKVKCVAVYKEALTDAELTCLTTI